MDAFLPKPFRAQDLASVLRRWLPRDGAADAEEAPAEASGGDDVFDFRAAVDAFMNQKNVVVKVMRQYMKKTEDAFATMEESLSSGNWDSLRVESHGIKGGGWNLTAKALGDAAAELEKAAKERNAEAAGKALKEFGVQHRRLAERLAALPDFAAE